MEFFNKIIKKIFAKKLIDCEQFALALSVFQSFVI